MKNWWWVALVAAVACGDDGGDPTGDGGSTAPCSVDTDCDDGNFCTGMETCDPDATGADARGCVSSGSPCAAGVECDDATDSCARGCPDMDGDGAEDSACGGTDCDDTNADVNPAATEICDLENVDEDCDPESFGDRDIDNDGFIDARCCNGANCGTDCDETRRGANPNVPEVCDGRDNDCDGNVDEELLQASFEDDDRDLHGDPDSPIMACPGENGTSASQLDCDDDEVTVNGPQGELRDGEDNDCDGEIDELPAEAFWYPDADNDGYGDASGDTVRSDTPIPGRSILPTDCDDGDATRSPRATEICNGVDDDCSGEANFVIGVNDWEDDDGDGYPDATCAGGSTRADCDDTDPITWPGAPERCDARDNDCDGTVDESCDMGGGGDADGGMLMGSDAGDPGGECSGSGSGSSCRTPGDLYCNFGSQFVTCGDSSSYGWQDQNGTPVDGECVVECVIDDEPTGQSCSYAPAVCDPDGVAPAGCDPGCEFPESIPQLAEIVSQPLGCGYMRSFGDCEPGSPGFCAWPQVETTCPGDSPTYGWANATSGVGSGDSCTIQCMQNGTPTGTSCTYEPTMCGETTTNFCDLDCGFPPEINGNQYIGLAAPVGPTCPPVVPPATTPSGNAYTGNLFSMPLDAADAFATVEEVATEGGMATAVTIHLTEYTNACNIEVAHHYVPDERIAVVRLLSYGADGPGGVPGVGTYAFGATPADPVTAPTAIFRGTSGFRTQVDGAGGCEIAPGAGVFPGLEMGMLEITVADATHIEGTWTYSQSETGFTSSGTFNAPLCTSAENGDRCCAGAGEADIVCDLLDQGSCVDGSGCYPTEDFSAVECATAGSSGQDQACVVPSDCQAGYVCGEGACRAICEFPGGSCPVIGSCVDSGIVPGVGVCISAP